jgi:nucleotide-binding universal stress UspA family protein
VIEGTQLKELAEKYLERVQVGLKARGIDCITSVLLGDPVIASFYTAAPIVKIAEYAQKANAQLLAMATHARGRVGQVLLGSVSEEEVWESHLPVMLVRIPSHHKHESEN